MPKYKVPFAIMGDVEITADDEQHATALFGRLSKSQIASRGQLETYPIEEIPHDRDGELADKHWDRVKEDAL